MIPSQLTQNIDYSTQYLVTYSASGNVLSISVPADEWVNSGGQATGSFPTQLINGAQDTECNFVSDNRPATIIQPTAITGTYQTQYYLIVTSPHNTATGAGWYNSGSAATISISSETASGSSGTRYAFTSWTGDASGTALTSSISMTGPKTATASWNTQYLVTYNEVGNALPVILPSNEWVNSGAAAQGKFVPSAVNSGNNTQCLFLNDNRTQSITQPTTVTGKYNTQYKVTFIQNGILSDAKGTILTILGIPEDYSKLANITWVNNGTQLTFAFNSTVESTIANKLYTLTGTNATSPITIHMPTLIEGNYQVENNTPLYTVLEIALIILAIFLAAISAARYRSRRLRKQKNLNEPANVSS